MTDFKQAFIVTAQNGKAFLVVCFASSFEKGEQKVKDLVLFPVYDVCSFPVDDYINEKCPGIYELKEAAQ